MTEGIEFGTCADTKHKNHRPPTIHFLDRVSLFFLLSYSIRSSVRCYCLVVTIITMGETHQGFYGWLNRLFEPIDTALGPSRQKYKPACVQDKEIFLECVLKSDCYAETQNFKYCVQEGITKDCKALRYNYYMCKRSQIFWHKSFSQDDSRRI